MSHLGPDWQSSKGKHKGGAWKVAYADFVTALMALFIVLWLLNSTKTVRDNVTKYFRDPKATESKPSGGGPSGGGSGAPITLQAKDIHELQRRLQEVFKNLPEYEFIKKHIRITVTGEGLRIELMETDEGVFFESGNPTPSPTGRRLLDLLAGELGRLPNTIIVEGHTDARPFKNQNLTGYTNWDLSLDRANAARKAMENYGLREGQIVQIRGFSSKKPLLAGDPDSSRNRRISVTVVYWPDEVGAPKHPAPGTAAAGTAASRSAERPK